MREELEQQLYAIDPVFFRQKDLDMTQTCMCWGIECGDGWFEPIKEFVEKVKVLNDMLKPNNTCIVASQIKSKWACFTCYWNQDTLDKDKGDDLTPEQVSLNNVVYNMMEDLVDACEKKCDHTCELCGKYEAWEGSGEIIVCGSWLTVKCLACAQESQRKAGAITDLREGFAFLSPFEKCAIKVDGVIYRTFMGAYYAQLAPQYKTMFSQMIEPCDVQDVAVELGLCRDDEGCFPIMEDLLKLRYTQHPTERKHLIGTKGLRIELINGKHENFWGKCGCGKCQQFENHYGKLLMKVRDEILEQENA